MCHIGHQARYVLCQTLNCRSQRSVVHRVAVTMSDRVQSCQDLDQQIVGRLEFPGDTDEMHVILDLAPVQASELRQISRVIGLPFQEKISFSVIPCAAIKL
jgi:hypothetical protein